MSQPASAQLLEQVLAKTLEEAAFIFAEPGEPLEPSKEIWEAKLGFKGPLCGVLLLSSSPQFAALLAANLLGIEPEDPEAREKSTDALGELLNILGGLLMKELCGDEAIYSLDPPAVRVVQAAEHTKALKGASHYACLCTEEQQAVDLALWGPTPAA